MRKQALTLLLAGALMAVSSLAMADDRQDADSGDAVSFGVNPTDEIAPQSDLLLPRFELDNERERAVKLHRWSLEMRLMGSDAEAIGSVLERAIRIDPFYAAPHRTLASVHAAEGDLGAMCRALRTYVLLADDVTEARRVEATLEGLEESHAACSLY